MANALFPPLNLSAWQPTRDTLHLYSQLAGKIRRALAPPHPHWWHVSLHVDEAGLTTPPIPTPDGRSFRLTLDLTRHTFRIALPDGDERAFPLPEQSPAALCRQTLDTLAEAGIHPDFDRAPFAGETIRPYHPPHAEAYRAALQSVHAVFRQFRAALPGERSPVQLWPHHFDLSLVWFSGREADVPAGEEGGPEQIGFGFSTGDEGVPKAYFYANPWPFPDGLQETPLPPGAQWHTAGWMGGLLLYRTVAAADDPAQTLLRFLQTVYRHAAARMQ
ncbi:MAG: hypothetical protein D6796_07580 [Caldilineae bacterium]|nr:MAG: hypothetical protein D6796_07580 [Caldilineae bacterium]